VTGRARAQKIKTAHVPPRSSLCVMQCHVRLRTCACRSCKRHVHRQQKTTSQIATVASLLVARTQKVESRSSKHDSCQAVICKNMCVQRAFPRKKTCTLVAAIQGFRTLGGHRRRRLQRSASFGVISPLKRKGSHSHSHISQKFNLWQGTLACCTAASYSALQRTALLWPANPESAQACSQRISGEDSKTIRAIFARSSFFHCNSCCQ